MSVRQIVAPASTTSTQPESIGCTENDTSIYRHEGVGDNTWNGSAVFAQSTKAKKVRKPDALFPLTAQNGAGLWRKRLMQPESAGTWTCDFGLPANPEPAKAPNERESPYLVRGADAAGRDRRAAEASGLLTTGRPTSTRGTHRHDKLSVRERSAATLLNRRRCVESNGAGDIGRQRWSLHTDAVYFPTGHEYAPRPSHA